MKIRPAGAPVTRRLLTLLYGAPGIGKTSLACTASKPIVVDFDDGSHRATWSVPTLPPGDWREAGRPLEWLRQCDGFDTLVIDSLGRAIDDCKQHVIAGNPFYRMRGTDTPTPQGYGALRAAFVGWLRQVRAGFDGQIVIVAHAREVKDEDGKPAGWRIEGTGGSVQAVTQECDMIGFVERLDDERNGVNWNPGHGGRDVTGKNPGRLPARKVEVDDLDFLQRAIDRTRERIRNKPPHSAVNGKTNHPDAVADSAKGKPRPASSTASAPETADDIPF